MIVKTMENVDYILSIKPLAILWPILYIKIAALLTLLSFTKASLLIRVGDTLPVRKCTELRETLGAFSCGNTERDNVASSIVPIKPRKNGTPIQQYNNNNNIDNVLLRVLHNFIFYNRLIATFLNILLVLTI